MTRKSLAALLTLCFLVSIAATALANGSSKVPTLEGNVEYAPPQETLINGIPESELKHSGDISPLGYWEWENRNHRYDPNHVTKVQYFKLIAEVSAFNPSYATPAPLALTVQQSSMVGSEFSGNVSFTVEVKNAILGGIQAEAGVGVKEYREVNEAVGATYTIYISPRRKGFIQAYWGGQSSSGTLFWDVYHYGEYYSTSSTGVGATVHSTYFHVNFNAWEQ